MATCNGGISTCLVAGSLVLAACGDSLEPNAADGALRSTLAIVAERVQGPFSTFPGLGGDGLTPVAIGQLLALGTLPRSGDSATGFTDDISDPSYAAAAFLIDSDIVTPQGLRFVQTSLHVLGWSGLDRNRTTVEAFLAVRATNAVADLVSGENVFANGYYYFAPSNTIWENSPTASFTVSTLRSVAPTRACRAPVPLEVECQVSSSAGRVAGAFAFFAKEVSPSTNSVFEFRRTAFDLPVTHLRIVDTLRFKDRCATPECPPTD